MGHKNITHVRANVHTPHAAATTPRAAAELAEEGKCTRTIRVNRRPRRLLRSQPRDARLVLFQRSRPPGQDRSKNPGPVRVCWCLGTTV